VILKYHNSKKHTIRRWNVLTRSTQTLMILIVVIALPILQPVKANENVETKLKVAYIANIARFTNWKQNDTNIVLCTNKGSKINDVVKALIDYPIGNGRILNTLIAPTDLSLCNIYFSDLIFDKSINLGFSTSQHPSILFLSDQKKALNNDFAIQFFVRNLKLRFSTNQAAIARANYKVSSKLLRLSRKLD
jgi:hypothetical protein